MIPIAALFSSSRGHRLFYLRLLHSYLAVSADDRALVWIAPPDDEGLEAASSQGIVGIVHRWWPGDGRKRPNSLRTRLRLLRDVRRSAPDVSEAAHSSTAGDVRQFVIPDGDEWLIASTLFSVACRLARHRVKIVLLLMRPSPPSFVKRFGKRVSGTIARRVGLRVLTLTHAGVATPAPHQLVDPVERLVHEPPRDSRQALGLSTEKRYIVLIGRIAEYKHIHKWLPLLASRVKPGCSILVVGEPETLVIQRDIERISESFPTVEIRLSYVPTLDFHRYINAADGVIIPHDLGTPSGVRAHAKAYGVDFFDLPSFSTRNGVFAKEFESWQSSCAAAARSPFRTPASNPLMFASRLLDGALTDRDGTKSGQ